MLHQARAQAQAPIYEEAALKLKALNVTYEDLLMVGIETLQARMQVLESEEKTRFHDEYMKLPEEVRATMSENGYIAAMNAKGPATILLARTVMEASGSNGLSSAPMSGLHH